MQLDLFGGGQLSIRTDEEKTEQGREEKNEAPRCAKKQLADPECHGEVEDEHRNVEDGTQQGNTVDSAPKGCFARLESRKPIEKLQRSHQHEAHEEPSSKIACGNSEVYPRIPIAVNLAQEPSIPLKSHGVNDDVQKNEQEGAKNQHAPGASKLSRLQRANVSRCELHRTQKKDRHGIAAIGEEYIR